MMSARWIEKCVRLFGNVWAGARAHPARALAAAAVVLLVVDWTVMDLWQIRGRVTDSTGHPIEGAWVLAHFHGEKPLLNIPIPPHPNHRTSECMGTRVTSSGSDGAFLFRELTWNRGLANKGADIVVFKPGWLTDAQDSNITSSLFAVFPTKEFEAALSRGPGERQQTSRLGVVTESSARLSPHDRTRSDELFHTQGMIVQSLCSAEGEVVIAAAMRHALQVAETFDERLRVRGACLFARRAIEQRDSMAATWPFDCENLTFAKEPSAEALAVEAELKARQRTWRGANPTERVIGHGS